MYNISITLPMLKYFKLQAKSEHLFKDITQNFIGYHLKYF